MPGGGIYVSVGAVFPFSTCRCSLEKVFIELMGGEGLGQRVIRGIKLGQPKGAQVTRAMDVIGASCECVRVIAGHQGPSLRSVGTRNRRHTKGGGCCIAKQN